ncbi:MAG: hypothetical protein HYY14_05390 [Candidatus Omnitrophica bacterium]|nr:hypothetical protein [Candidatus Omnitrophota bacterium]
MRKIIGCLVVWLAVWGVTLPLSAGTARQGGGGATAPARRMAQGIANRVRGAIDDVKERSSKVDMSRVSRFSENAVKRVTDPKYSQSGGPDADKKKLTRSSSQKGKKAGRPSKKSHSSKISSRIKQRQVTLP